MWCLMVYMQDATSARIHINTMMVINIAIGIQNGDNTHHQLQLITPPNFKPINKIVNVPKNPTPPDELESLLIKKVPPNSVCKNRLLEVQETHVPLLQTVCNYCQLQFQKTLLSGYVENRRNIQMVFQNDMDLG